MNVMEMAVRMSADWCVQWQGGEVVQTHSPNYSSLLLSSLELSDTEVYEPERRALLGTGSHFCETVASQNHKQLT